MARLYGRWQCQGLVIGNVWPLALVMTDPEDYECITLPLMRANIILYRYYETGERLRHFMEQSVRGTLLLLRVEHYVPRTFVEQSEILNWLIVIVEHPWNIYGALLHEMLRSVQLVYARLQSS